MNLTFSMLKTMGGMLMTLLASTLMGVSTSDWIMVWMSMEINTLTMCWMLSKESKMINMEKSPMNYYLIQVMASIMLVMTVMQEKTTLTSTLSLVCLMAKIGNWPIHTWYLKLINSMEMNQMSMMMVMTWQKILPISLAVSMSLSKFTILILMIISMMSLITPLIKLEKNLKVKSIVALSSLNNNSWLLIGAMLSFMNFTSFLILYMSTLHLTLKTLYKTTNKSNSLIGSFWLTTMILANMGGLPPMTMFWGKLLILKTTLMQNLSSEITTTLMMSACFLLYHYMWMLSHESTKKPMKNQLSQETKKNLKLMGWMFTFSMLGITMMLMLGFTQVGFILMG